jgi:hypothetical protein
MVRRTGDAVPLSGRIWQAVLLYTTPRHERGMRECVMIVQRASWSLRSFYLFNYFL